MASLNSLEIMLGYYLKAIYHAMWKKLFVQEHTFNLNPHA
jgi:hypothetical protein